METLKKLNNIGKLQNIPTKKLYELEINYEYPIDYIKTIYTCFGDKNLVVLRDRELNKFQVFLPDRFNKKLENKDFDEMKQELVRNSSKIKITTMAISPYCELNTRNNELIVDGPDFKILSIVAQKLKNIKFEFVQPIEKTFGSKLKDGSWNGIIGRVQRKEVDLSTLSLCVTYDRFQVVDFTIPVTGDKVVFIVSSPKQLSKLTAIIRPFSLKTWIYIVVSTFVTAISFSFIAFVRNNYFPERKTAWTTRNFTWFLLRSLTSQGGEIDYDKSTSSRVIIGVWLLATTVLISAYGGILFSYMTRPVYEEVPKNIEQLAIAVKNKEYSCGTLSNSALSELMLGKSEGTVKILSEYISSHPEESFSTFQQGIQHMLHHKYAYITSAYFFATLNMRENSFVISEDLFMSYSIAFPTKKKFKFKNKFNKMLRRLVDAGIYEKLLREAKQAPGVGYTDIHHPLSIDDGMSAFILLGSGYLSSYLKVKKVNHTVVFDGIDFKFLSSVIQNLKNVQYEIIEPVKKVFGINLVNGTWNGLIGRIQI
ncbi:glutamate receptor U1-like [Centruroides vittatus]|uniref:glutamate receptor U1-like n=1 Tax=Centruroides vittatus TaxID=120091 RepID=UPI00350EE3F6